MLTTATRPWERDSPALDHAPRQIVLFRHGVAERRAAPAEDANRRLTRAGRDTVLRAARGMRRLIPKINLIISSPLPRARETARVIAEVYRPRHGLMELAELRPGGHVRLVAARLRAWRLHAIVVVGHEPDLTQLARSLVGSAAFSGLHLSKSGACLLEFDGVPPNQARLRWLFTAHQLQHPM